MSKTLRRLLVKGTDTGYKDHFGNVYLIGSLVEYTDSEGFTCISEIIVRDNFSVGIDSWDRSVDINEMENSEEYIVFE